MVNENFSGDVNQQSAVDAMWAEVEPPRKSHKAKETKPVKVKASEDDDKILIPGGCTRCAASFQVRVKKSELGNYTYSCPRCGQKMTVKSQSFADRSKAEDTKNLLIIAASFFGGFIALWLTSKTIYAWPSIAAMMIYDLWMLMNILSKNPRVGIGTRILAVLFFVISEMMLVNTAADVYAYLVM